MYVLVIGRGYPSEKYKLNGIFEFDQAKALSKIGCKVVYVALDVRSIRRWRRWGIYKEKVQGIETYSINIPLGRVPYKLLNKISSFALKHAYKKILKDHGKPQVIHGHFTDISYVAATLKKENEIPLVVTEHFSHIMKDDIDKEFADMASYAYEKADTVIAVSPALKNIIKEKFHKDALYVPNIVDTELFSYSPRGSDKSFRFVSTGALTPIKRMDITIEAFARAFSHNEDVELIIFGEGPERNKIQSIIEKYDINSKVKLLGVQSREVMAKSLTSSHCFVLASESETFGVAYIEALACGNPVIATKCGGPEAFVTEENGVLVPVEDMDSLVTAMRYMHKNSMNYDREKISKVTASLFSPQEIANRLLEVYKNII